MRCGATKSGGEPPPRWCAAARIRALQARRQRAIGAAPAVRWTLGAAVVNPRVRSLRASGTRERATPYGLLAPASEVGGQVSMQIEFAAHIPVMWVRITRSSPVPGLYGTVFTPGLHSAAVLH